MLDFGFYNMDCLDGMKQFPDKYFDLCLTDPPYGVNLAYKTYQDTEDNWYKLMDKFIPEAQRISKMVIMPSCQIKRLDWFYKNHPPDWLICWYKGSTGCSSFIGFNDWEPLVVYGKTKSKLFMHDYFYSQPDERMGNFNHPCPKPLSWAKWLILKSTDKNDKIIDPFCGSGTTAVACYELNRPFVGFEIDKDYYEAASKRLADVKAQVRFDFAEQIGI